MNLPRALDKSVGPWLCRTAALGALFSPLLACPSRDELKLSAEARQLPKQVSVQPVSRANRFGYRESGFSEAPVQAASKREIGWRVPPGWTEIASTAMRRPNFIIDDNPDAQCYLTRLGGTGGGIEANVNRWRAQMSLAPLTSAEIGALARITVLDRPAVYVEFEGTYTGMGGSAKPNVLLAGAMLELDDQGIFIKMIGPAASIGPHLGHLRDFMSSLHLHGRGVESAAPEGSSGQDSPPATGSPDGRASSTQAVNPHGTLPTTGRKLTWKAPAGWQIAPARQMRLVTYRIASDVEIECYITTLPGQAGGLIANLNRWRQQLGHGPLTAEQIDTLEKVTVLGLPTPLLDVTGPFQGMSGPVRHDYAMLAVVDSRPNQSIFVKMIGPEQAVHAQRSNFLAFCASIKAGE